VFKVPPDQLGRRVGVFFRVLHVCNFSLALQLWFEVGNMMSIPSGILHPNTTQFELQGMDRLAQQIQFAALLRLEDCDVPVATACCICRTGSS
jgi:hypothetical protein